MLESVQDSAPRNISSPNRLTAEIGEHPTSRILRLGALALAGLGTFVTPVELLMVNHIQKLTQLIPFVLLGINAGLIVWLLLRPSAQNVRIFQVFCGVMLLGGLVGVGFHLHANYEMALQFAPDARGLNLLLEVLRGSNPVLAPGLFAQLALLGLMFTYKHPKSSAAKF